MVSRANIERFASGLFAKPIAQSRLYEKRDYQIAAATSAVSYLDAEKNVALELPTGTGKTLICCLVAAYWKSIRPASRILLLVPRRALIEQHRAVAAWICPETQPMAITADDGKYFNNMIAKLTRGNFIISTPEILANSFRRRRIPREIIRSFSLVMIDEFDEFLVSDYEEVALFARFHLALDNLINTLPDDAVYFLTTATDPASKTSNKHANQELENYSELVASSFSPQRVEVPDREIDQYLPTAEVHFKCVQDTSVNNFARAIQTGITVGLNDLEWALGFKIDPSFIFPRLEGLLSGRIKKIPVSAAGNKRSVNAAALRACRKLQYMLNKYDFLGEDLFKDHRVEDRGTLVLIDVETREEIRIAALHLIDPGHSRHHAELREKFTSLTQIIDQHQGEKGVVFVRYIETGREILVKLRSEGKKVTFLHGELADPERRKVVCQFSR